VAAADRGIHGTYLVTESRACGTAT
jgi:hypothetical protein